ncbi:hypothetical protein [uncultured Shimia sp.]|uniref:hypothetical protein n=1 Tax=uncultured Shimia sp. TaxID=573152 RepID=UPI002619B14D|nr:hypothetical protein [uncultured Shimia sp.]
MTKQETNFIHYDNEYLDAHQASGLAYALRDTIAVAFCAFDNDGSNVELDNRGISSTLERAEKMARELIDRCEMLERNQAKAQP